MLVGAIFSNFDTKKRINSEFQINLKEAEYKLIGIENTAGSEDSQQLLLEMLDLLNYCVVILDDENVAKFIKYSESDVDLLDKYVKSLRNLSMESYIVGVQSLDKQAKSQSMLLLNDFAKSYFKYVNEHNEKSLELSRIDYLKNNIVNFNLNAE